MRGPQHHPGKAKQRGAALMVMLVIMVMGALTFLVSSLSSSALKNARQEKTVASLAQAKEALVGYAITYGDFHANQVHGYLPCPDTDAGNGEGSSKLSCNGKNVSSIGRLPWKTLGLPQLRDGDGECLWYAVSGTYKYNPKTDLMNWDNNGLLEILDASGAPTAQKVVAVVIAPGAAFGSQSRAADGTAPTCGGNYTASNYLDSNATIGANNAITSTVANASSKYFTADTTANINDQIIFITISDIFNAIKKRNDFSIFVATLLNAAETCASQPVTINFDTTPPTEAPGGTIGSLTIGRVPKTCLASPLDNWQDNLIYAKCTSANCLSVNGTGCNGVVIFSGEGNIPQTRIFNTDKNTWSNYLEDTPSANLAAFTSGGTTFSGATSYSATSPSTDVLACIP